MRRILIDPKQNERGSNVSYSFISTLSQLTDSVPRSALATEGIVEVLVLNGDDDLKNVLEYL